MEDQHIAGSLSALYSTQRKDIHRSVCELGLKSMIPGVEDSTHS
jgi:hypothetical protein